jgi:predicted nucleotidyltransferase
MALSKHDIVSRIKANTALLTTTYHVQRLGLFGSFVKNNATSASDLDFLVEFEPGIPDVYETKQHLKQFLKDTFHRSVDLASYRYLHPYARQSILSEVEPLVGQ